MGNYVCKKCGVPLSYYNNTENSSRKSCRFHDNNAKNSLECVSCRSDVLFFRNYTQVKNINYNSNCRHNWVWKLYCFY